MRLLMLFLAVLFGSGITEKVYAEDLIWVFGEKTHDGSDKPGTLVTYSVNDERTRIETENEIICIDYTHYTLYRYHKHDGSCLKFPINSGVLDNANSRKSHSKKNNNSLSVDYKVFITDRHQNIGNYNCQLKQILFGANLAKLQTVRSPVVHEFGQSFTGLMVSYCVSKDVVGVDRLSRIAKKHESIYLQNPFLRQIDLVSLIEVLQGFPVQISQKVHDREKTMTLLEAPRTGKENMIPTKCK